MHIRDFHVNSPDKEKRYIMPGVLLKWKYSVPTPELNKIKKRFPREKRRGVAGGARHGFAHCFFMRY